MGDKLFILGLLMAWALLAVVGCTTTAGAMRSCNVMCHPNGVRKYDATMNVCECNHVEITKDITED